MSAWQRGPFSPLANPAYRTLWTATLIQFLGMMTIGVVRGFLAFDLTESNTAVGGLFFAFGIALFPSMFGAGVVTDRFSRKSVLTTTQLFLAVQTLLFAIVIIADLLEYWMLLVQSVLEGITVAFLAPSRQAMNGQLLSADSVGRGVALQQGSMGVARIIGPAAGGALVGTVVGVGGVFMIVAALYLAAALITFRVPGTFKVDDKMDGSFLQNFLAGIRYVRGRPSLLVIVLISYVVAFSAFPYFVFLPGMVLDIFSRDAFELGIITSAASAGSVVVAVAVAAVVQRPQAWGLFLGISFAFGLVVALFGLVPNYPLALLVIILIGGAEMGFIALAMGLGMAYAHRLYDGRMQALIISSFSLFGVSSLPLGLLGDQIGIRAALIIEGTVGTLLVGIVIIYAHRINAFADAQPPTEEKLAPLINR